MEHQTQTSKIYNLPNFLSATRIVLIVPILLLLHNSYFLSSMIISTGAFLTDYIDGKLARSAGTTTMFGSILDAVADKFIILACMGYFAYSRDLDLRYFAIAASRDILQLLAVPILIGYRKIIFKVKPNLIAKTGTAIKYLILALIFLHLLTNTNMTPILTPILIISGILEIFILVTYFRRFLLVIRGEHDTFE